MPCADSLSKALSVCVVWRPGVSIQVVSVNGVINWVWLISVDLKSLSEIKPTLVQGHAIQIFVPLGAAKLMIFVPIVIFVYGTQRQQRIFALGQASRLPRSTGL
jgi:hypothetical protein